MKKFDNKSRAGEGAEIPDRVLARLRQSFQKPGTPDHPCPEPEDVIACALGELTAAAERRVQDHLLSCRECLDLFLDIRLAQDEAERPEDGLPAERAATAGWLTHFGQRIRKTWDAVARPRRLVPALAAISLVVLVFILGRDYNAKVRSPSRLALEKQEAKETAREAAPPQELAATSPAPEASGSRLAALKKKAGIADLARQQAPTPGAPYLAAPSLSLDFSAVPDPAGGFRLSYRADREVYAYLLRQEDSGDLTLLFSGRLAGEKTYFYPLADHRRQAAPASARVTYFLVAAEKPLPAWPPKLQEPESPWLRSVESLFPDALHRSLTVTLP